MRAIPWHRMSIDQACEELGTSHRGLSRGDARSRLARYGPNELVEKRKKSPLGMFLDQFKDFMILVLMAAAIVSGIIGEPSDTIAIIIILLLNAALGFSQEYRAEKAMEALKKMAAVNATVVRSGERTILPASEIVPGDIVLLEAGNVVPADLRVIESARLTVEEAALTGESLPVEKHAAPLPDDTLPLGDRMNMVYKGTVVTYGRGRGVAVATAMGTELGRIATMLQQEEEGKTPLQKRLAHFGRRISIVILIICAVVFAAGILRGEPAVNIFLVAVSLAVAAIPEALPAVVTIALALGARKMVKLNALVRKLPAVETLGSVTYICTDKTGTLTLNRMTVQEVWVDGKALKGPGSGVPVPGREDLSGPWSLDPGPLFFIALALSNDAREDSSGSVMGDPTETALYLSAQQRGFDKGMLESSHPRIAEIPFDSERKLMTTIHKGSGKAGEYFSFTKGAFDVLIDRADFVLTSEGQKPIRREDIQAAHDRMADEGLRVLAVGVRTWASLPDVRTAENVEKGLVLLGLVGMMDPPREEAMQAVAECRSAGITPVMITGDHPLTARVIARRVGILDSNDPGALITGAELAALPLDAFEKRVESIRVYARVAPEQKLKIVRALQDRGHFVAMTGDGVNDAPALKRADIGVAMGITGTDVAKEASAMILLDDNFATIVRAVREGRKIYDNIRKFIRYLLATNSGEIGTLFLAPFFGLPIPLQPIHILWINLVTDSLPALALTLEPGEPNLMSRAPRSPREGLFSHGLGAHAVWVGLLMAAVVLGLQAWTIHIQDGHWQTMVFTTLCLLQLGHAMAIRSEHASLFTQGVLSNKPLFMAVIATIGLQLTTVYVPALNPVFKTAPLSAGELGLVLALSSVVFFAVELEKLIKRFQKTA